MVLKGFSGCPTSVANASTIIGELKARHLNTYRVAFTASWTTSSRPRAYSPNGHAYIKAFLDAGLTVIVDRNHRVKSNDSNVIPWTTALSDLLEVLNYFKADPNFKSLGVELFNEYSGADEYTQGQILVNGIRNAGFTNTIYLCNQPGPAMKKLVNPTGKSGAIVQGIHHYMDEGKDWQGILGTLKSLGCDPLIGTEFGAATTTTLYDQAGEGTALVTALNNLIAWNDANNVSTLIWMDDDLHTLPLYNLNGGLNLYGPDPVDPCADLRAQIALLQGQVSNLTSANLAYKAAETNYQTQITDLNKQIGVIQGNLANVSASNQALQDMATALKAKIVKAVADLQ